MPAPLPYSGGVDLKGFSKETYRRIAHLEDFSGILKATKQAKKRWGMWVEVVTNIIPGYNDAEEELRRITRWIKMSWESPHPGT